MLEAIAFIVALLFACVQFAVVVVIALWIIGWARRYRGVGLTRWALGEEATKDGADRPPERS